MLATIQNRTWAVVERFFDFLGLILGYIFSAIALFFFYTVEFRQPILIILALIVGIVFPWLFILFGIIAIGYWMDRMVQK